MVGEMKIARSDTFNNKEQEEMVSRHNQEPDHQEGALWSIKKGDLSKCVTWHADYFELQTMKAQKTQKELYTSPLTASKNLEGFVKEESYHQR